MAGAHFLLRRRRRANKLPRSGQPSCLSVGRSVTYFGDFAPRRSGRHRRAASASVIDEPSGAFAAFESELTHTATPRSAHRPSSSCAAASDKGARAYLAPFATPLCGEPSGQHLRCTGPGPGLGTAHRVAHWGTLLARAT